MRHLACDHCGKPFQEGDVDDDTAKCAFCGSCQYVGLDENTPDGFFAPVMEREPETPPEDSKYSPAVIVFWGYQLPNIGNSIFLGNIYLSILFGIAFNILGYLCFELTKRVIDRLDEKWVMIWPKAGQPPATLVFLTAMVFTTWPVWVPGLIFLTIIREFLQWQPLIWAYEGHLVFLLGLGSIAFGSWKRRLKVFQTDPGS